MFVLTAREFTDNQLGSKLYDVRSISLAFPVTASPLKEVVKILQTADFRGRLKGLGLQGSTMTFAQVTEFRENEVEKWVQVVMAASIKLE